MVTPFALSSIGYKYYIVYAVIGVTYIISVYFFYPETMGQSLETLEDLFQQDLSIRQTVRYANRLTGVGSSGDKEGRPAMEDFKGGVKQVERVT